MATQSVSQIAEGGVTRSAAAFWKYWAASATSNVGAGVTRVALPIIALTTLSASNFEMGLLAAAGYTAVILVGLPSGVIVQRYSLRGMQISMDVFRAIAVLTVPLAAWLGVLTMAHLLLVALLMGLAHNLFDMANATFLPRIVSRQELISRNGLMSGTIATTQLAGPALGGLLVQAVGAAVSIVFDAITYAVSAVLLGRIPNTGSPVPTARQNPFGQIAVGLRYVFLHPVIRPSLIAASAVNFANGALYAVTAPFIVRTLGLPVGMVGVVLAIDGLGTVAAAALTARLARRLGTARALILSTTGGAVLALAMPLAFTSWAPVLFGLGVAGFAAGVCVLSVVTRTHRQTVSPPELLSRVMASVRFVSWSVIPIGSVLAGAAAEVWGPRAGLVLAFAAAAVAPIAIYSSRIRKLRELTDGEALPQEPEPARS
jgi:MFS family permease